MGSIPTEVSRHNTPSRAHALTKVVQSEAKSGENVAIIVSTCQSPCALVLWVQENNSSMHVFHFCQAFVDLDIVFTTYPTLNRWCVSVLSCLPQAAVWRGGFPTTP